jgi:transcriptional regulator of met regulon
MSRIGGRGPGSRIQHDKTIDTYKDKGKQAEQIETIPSAVTVSEVTLQPPTIAGVSYLNSLPEELLCEIFIYALSEGE